MFTEFQKFIHTYQLFTQSDKILLTVSGGVDSVVLANLCKMGGYQFAIAHCNFQLRGTESEQDSLFVEALASQLGISFFTKRFDTKKYAQQQRVSTQMAARELRYAWFETLCQIEGFTHIVTAHHLNDSLETILFNLAKGTGIDGMRGILPKKKHLVRPLLFASKRQIIDFAQIQGFAWREDSSNNSNTYQRNKIRQEVVPLLEYINPNLEQTLVHTIERLLGSAQLYHIKIQELYEQLVRTEGNTLIFDIASLKAYAQQNSGNIILAKTILSEWLKPYQFNYQQVSDIIEAKNTLTGKQFATSTHCLSKNRNHWILSSIAQEHQTVIYIGEQDNEVLFNGDIIKIEPQIGSETILQYRGSRYVVQKNKLIYPLVLRAWQQGDWFCPKGMKGKRKKVSDFFVDSKVPRQQKEQIPILLNGNGDIIWIVGMRGDERYI
jgi:tRNA(Ile)-lysidine synthase